MLRPFSIPFPEVITKVRKLDWLQLLKKQHANKHNGCCSLNVKCPPKAHMFEYLLPSW